MVQGWVGARGKGDIELGEEHYYWPGGGGSSKEGGCLVKISLTCTCTRYCVRAYT